MDAFDPDMVISNNSHWEEKDFESLKGKSFHILPGAVNTDIFFPRQKKQIKNKNDLWIIGGIAPKNLKPLLDGIELLPDNYQLHLFGKVPGHLRWRLWNLCRKRKVVSHGPIFGEGLVNFYRNIDVMVTTEKEAGWCNAAAEASATGVPCIATRHGTIDFLKHMKNSLILDEISGPAIAENIIKLTTDEKTCNEFTQNAMSSIKDFSHTKYCDKLLTLLKSHSKN